MAREAELPDGTVLEFPDGTPDDVMDKAVRSHLAPPAQNGFARLGVGGVMKQAGELTGRALAQGLAGIGNAGTYAPRKIAELVHGQPMPDLREGVDSGLDRLGVADYATPGQQALGNVSEALFGTVATMGLGGLTGAKALASAPATQVAAALTGAGAAEGVKAAGGGELAQTGAALLGGFAPGGATAALRRPGAAAALAAKAERQGVPLRRGSVAPGPVTQALRSIPGTGAKGRYAADVAKVNDRVADLIGAPKGTPPERVYPAALARNGAEFDDFARNHTLTLDAPLLKRLTDFRNAPDALDGPSPAAKAAVDKFLDEAAQGGNAQVPGGLFKALDTALGGQKGARGLVNALRDAFKSGMPAEDAARWSDLMRRYGDMKTVERLFAKAAGQPIDPRQLLGAVTATKAGKARMAAQTRGELGELAEVGRYVVPPQSGAANLVAPGVLAGSAGGAGLASGGAALPAAAAGYGFGNLFGRLIDLPVYTPAQQRAVRTGAAIGAGHAANRRDK